jgi:hypothetical protein
MTIYNRIEINPNKKTKGSGLNISQKNPRFKPLDSFSQLSVFFKFQIKPFARLCHRRISYSELRTDCS